ncbi:MAG: class I SAM-dependent methyltransferase, partial [Lachnospiraceae bacterium]|nr:class I SAM-dependent methyltransferase [Lachnospiraceae bacterium]
WKQKNAHYHRSKKGGGEWEFLSLPEEWQIGYTLSSGAVLSFHLKPFSFKHTGLFPEQAVNWEEMIRLILDARKNGKKDIRVLNLFAYTGGATIACASAGARVTHVDASKGMVSWAKENAVLSGLKDAPIRWLVDDCAKFVAREIRRGNHYDAILLDPPSYGRGPKGEIWKIEESLHPFLRSVSQLLSDEPLFVFLNSYTTGLAPGVLTYLLSSVLRERGFSAEPGKVPSHNRGRRFVVGSDEIGLPVEGSGLILPCGACGRAVFVP